MIHAVKTIEKLLENNDELRKNVEELKSLKCFMTFGARLIKCLFKDWLMKNKDAEIHDIPEYSVCSALQYQNNAEFEDIMATYNSTSVFGGEVELQILAFLAPGLKIQIEQPPSADAVSGNVDDTKHTFFLKREQNKL